MTILGKKRPLAQVCQALAASVLIAICAAVPVTVQAQGGLPTLGDGSDLTSSEERRLGDRIIRELYRDPDYIDDPVIAEYVQGIWQPLIAAARSRGELSAELDERFAWEVLLGRDRTVNAFALPGGYLGLHLGLIGVVGTRDELASVMAHELSHVTQRHISRLLTQQSRQTPLLLGAMVLGALAASKNPGATQALVVGGQALALRNQRNFSRDRERGADRVGMGLMEPAGFAPEGFVGMFDKLQQANRINDNGSWPYLRSHPLTTQRIADMQSRLPSGAKPAGSISPMPTRSASRSMSREKLSWFCRASACPPTTSACVAPGFLLAASAPSTIAPSSSGVWRLCCVSKREMCRCVTWLSSCAITEASSSRVPTTPIKPRCSPR